MQGSLIQSFSSMQLSARPRPALSFKASVGGSQLVVAPMRSSVIAAAGVVIQAKQNSAKRQRTAEKSRMHNKSRKSEISTRMKKVFTALDLFTATPPTSETDLAPVATLMNEAYQVIDKAISQGILHRNTGARRKARLARARKTVLISAGLYTPALAQ